MSRLGIRECLLIHRFVPTMKGTQNSRPKQTHESMHGHFERLVPPWKRMMQTGGGLPMNAAALAKGQKTGKRFRAGKGLRVRSPAANFESHAVSKRLGDDLPKTSQPTFPTAGQFKLTEQVGTEPGFLGHQEFSE